MIKTVRNLLIAQGLLLLAAVLISIYSMLEAAAWSPNLEMVGFIVWATSPYVSFFAASRLLSKLVPSSNLPLPAFVIAALMLAFTIYAYIGTMGDGSSTYSLIFIFVPLYLFVGSFFLLSIALAVAWMIRRGRPR